MCRVGRKTLHTHSLTRPYVRPSVRPSVCNAVHCGSQGWCTQLNSSLLKMVAGWLKEYRIQYIKTNQMINVNEV